MQKALATLNKYKSTFRNKPCACLTWNRADWGLSCPSSIILTCDDFLLFDDVEAVSETLFGEEQGIHVLVSQPWLPKLLYENAFFYIFNTKISFHLTSKLYHSTPLSQDHKGEITAVLTDESGDEAALAPASVVHPAIEKRPSCFVDSPWCQHDPPVKPNIVNVKWWIKGDEEGDTVTTSSEPTAASNQIALTSHAHISRWSDLAFTELLSASAKKLLANVPRVTVGANPAIKLHQQVTIHSQGKQIQCTIEANPSYVRIHDHHGGPMRVMANQLILKAMDATVNPMDVLIGARVMSPSSGEVLGMVVARSEKVDDSTPGVWIATPTGVLMQELGLFVDAPGCYGPYHHKFFKHTI